MLLLRQLGHGAMKLPSLADDSVAEVILAMV
jgi:hypothetical protein